MQRKPLVAWCQVTIVLTSILLTACTRLNTTATPATTPQWSVLNVAHRGGIAPDHPENTLSAFHRAVASGADVLEIDLRGTKDGAIVVVHDATLERTTNGHGRVSEHTLAQLKALDAGNGQQIPTYQEVLQLVRSTGVKLLLDIKTGPVLDREKVVRVTEQQRAVLDVIVGVRTLEDLRHFRALNPNLRTLGFVLTSAEIDGFAAAGADIIRLWPLWIGLSPRLVEKVHGLGKPVWATANDASPEELEKLIGFGVNGILTDRPEALRTVLEQRARARGS